MSNVIEINNLVKRYKELVALDHLSLEDQRGRNFWSPWSEWFGKNHNH